MLWNRRDFVFFFFFQAEDGIRDLIVTGVQTCALPISCWSAGTDQAGHVALGFRAASEQVPSLLVLLGCDLARGKAAGENLERGLAWRQGRHLVHGHPLRTDRVRSRRLPNRPYGQNCHSRHQEQDQRQDPEEVKADETRTVKIHAIPPGARKRPPKTTIHSNRVGWIRR